MNIHHLLNSIYNPLPIFDMNSIFHQSIHQSNAMTPNQNYTNISVQTSPFSPEISHSISKQRKQKWDYSVKDLQKHWNERDIIMWVIQNAKKKTKSQLNVFLKQVNNLSENNKEIIKLASERQYNLWKKNYFIENERLFKKYQKKDELPVFFEYLSREELIKCLTRYHYNLHMKDADTAYKTLRKKYWPISRKFIREEMIKIVKECEQCNRVDDLPKEPRHGSVVNQIKQPNQRWIIGK